MAGMAKSAFADRVQGDRFEDNLNLIEEVAQEINLLNMRYCLAVMDEYKNSEVCPIDVDLLGVFLPWHELTDIRRKSYRKAARAILEDVDYHMGRTLRAA